MAGTTKDWRRQKVVGRPLLKHHGSGAVGRLRNAIRIRRGVPEGCRSDANRFPPQSITLLSLVAWRVRHELRASIFYLYPHFFLSSQSCDSRRNPRTAAPVLSGVSSTHR